MEPFVRKRPPAAGSCAGVTTGDAEDDGTELMVGIAVGDGAGLGVGVGEGEGVLGVGVGGGGPVAMVSTLE